jgi:hypothetical protein
MLPVGVAVYAGGTILAGGAILSGAKRWNAGQSCAHTTTTLERPDSLGRWTFSIGNGGSSWDVVWIERSWPSGSGGYLAMSGRA